MSEMIAWIAAEAEKPAGTPETLLAGQSRKRRRNAARAESLVQRLPAHQFGAKAEGIAKEETVEREPGVAYPVDEGLTWYEQQKALEELRNCDQERRIYRGRTCTMLRRYMRYSLETGRIPSLVGREFFRSRVTKYRVTTFEDRVIFVHDMETCLGKLDEFSRQVLGRVVLQEYDHWETARLLGCTRMTVHRKLLEALDKLSDILLGVDLLDALSSHAEKSCQEGEEADFFVSDCEQEK